MCVCGGVVVVAIVFAVSRDTFTLTFLWSVPERSRLYHPVTSTKLVTEYCYAWIFMTNAETFAPEAVTRFAFG